MTNKEYSVSFVKKLNIKYLTRLFQFTFFLFLFLFSDKINGQEFKPDTSFAIQKDFNGKVIGVIKQAGGRSLVYGDFTNYKGITANKLVVILKNGKLDVNFRTGTGFNGEVIKVILQPDKKLIAVGKFTEYNGDDTPGIVRLHPNGLRDTSFSINRGFNVVEANISPLWDVVLQPDGKIIAAGEFTSFNGIAIKHLVRLHKNGSVDSAFSSKMKFDDNVYGIKLQPDGKILAVGAFSTCDGEHASYKIARINKNGDLDVDFNTNIATGFYTQIGAGKRKGFFKDTFIPKTVHLDSKGNILVRGDFEFVDGMNKQNFIQINADGSLAKTKRADSDFTLYQLKIQARTIGNSYIIKTSNGKLIVMDGGFQAEATYLRDFIKKLGGKVEAWFLSHPHPDHAGAFNKILNDPQGVEIKNIYHSKPPESWIPEPIYQGLYIAMENAAKSGVNVVNYTEIPEEIIIIDGVNFKILSVVNPELNTPDSRINDSSMAIRVWDENKSMVFLGDLEIEGGNKLLNGSQRKYLDCDYLQMSHHGNRGVGKNFYRSVKFKACLWPTPWWLWDNEAGSAGFNTGKYDTLEQRNLVDNELGIKRNYIGAKGLNIIR